MILDRFLLNRAARAAYESYVESVPALFLDDFDKLSDWSRSVAEKQAQAVADAILPLVRKYPGAAIPSPFWPCVVVSNRLGEVIWGRTVIEPIQYTLAFRKRFSNGLFSQWHVLTVRPDTDAFRSISQAFGVE